MWRKITGSKLERLKYTPTPLSQTPSVLGSAIHPACCLCSSSSSRPCGRCRSSTVYVQTIIIPPGRASAPPPVGGHTPTAVQITRQVSSLPRWADHPLIFSPDRRVHPMQSMLSHLKGREIGAEVRPSSPPQQFHLPLFTPPLSPGRTAMISIRGEQPPVTHTSIEGSCEIHQPPSLRWKNQHVF